MFRLGFAEHIADAAVILVDAGFGPYLIRAAGRGLLDGAKDLLFVATSRERSRQTIVQAVPRTVGVTAGGWPSIAWSGSG